MCMPHTCYNCGLEVGAHGLSSRSSQGPHQRHAEVNNIIYRVLSSANVPSHLEPLVLRGKRPDDDSVEERASACMGCNHEIYYAPSYVSFSITCVGEVAA